MVEIIGFIISLLALFYLFFKQNKSYSIYPDNEEINDPFKEFSNVNEEKSDSKKILQHPLPPPPKKKAHSKKSSSTGEYLLNPSLENRQSKSSVEDRNAQSKLHHENLPRGHHRLPSHLEDQKKEPKTSRLQLAVKRLAHRKDMIIYQEIMGKPKSLRNFLYEQK